jgi:hypothetical protein
MLPRSETRSCAGHSKELLEAASQAELLLGRDRDGAAGSVDNHAGLRDTLGRELALFVIEAEAEVVGEPMPTSLEYRAALAVWQQTGQPPVRPAQGGWGGVLVTNISKLGGSVMEVMVVICSNWPM